MVVDSWMFGATHLLVFGWLFVRPRRYSVQNVVAGMDDLVSDGIYWQITSIVRSTSKDYGYHSPCPIAMVQT